MSSELKLWARKAFELLFHAESHLRGGKDYDRRLALISFDNSIEVSISIYLTLNPIQRGNKHYPKDDVEKWLKNYHTRLDFFSQEIKQRGLPEHKGKDQIVWLHEQRNELYHGSSAGVPELHTLEEIRAVALWIFSVLFDRSDVEPLLDEALKAAEKPEPVIPQDFAKPKPITSTLPSSDPQKASALAVAAIIGKWDEGNSADTDIVRRLANEF